MDARETRDATDRGRGWKRRVLLFSHPGLRPSGLENAAGRWMVCLSGFGVGGRVARSVVGRRIQSRAHAESRHLGHMKQLMTERRAAVRNDGSVQVRTPVPPSGGQDTAVAMTWPLRSFLELGAYPEAVPCARLHAKAVLWEWGLGRAENAELVISEIVTNAIQASRMAREPSVVRLWLLSDRHRIVILVWDASPRPPVLVAHDPGEFHEGGWGLMLVDSLSDRWSWYSVPDGKVVWAMCSDGKRGNGT
jgi:anti-sigma regulatory factor (Ser/Thr protein kinase)